MSFSIQNTADWLKKHKWAVTLIVAISFGYTLGKDRALRDNAIEAQARGEGL